MSKLYLLTRTHTVDWDEYEAKLVRASSAQKAREIANGDVGQEGEIWTNRVLVSHQIIDSDGPDAVIIQSYIAG